MFFLIDSKITVYSPMLKITLHSFSFGYVLISIHIICSNLVFEISLCPKSVCLLTPIKIFSWDTVMWDLTLTRHSRNHVFVVFLFVPLLMLMPATVSDSVTVSAPDE